MKRSVHWQLMAFIVIFMAAIGENYGADSWRPEGTVSSLLANQYLGFGSGAVLSKDPALQTDALITFKNGLYADFWISRSLVGKWDDGSLGNEVDYGVGWKGNLVTNLSVNLGVTYFDEPRAFKLGAGDIIYGHAFLTRDFKYLSLSLGYENYTTMPNSGFEGGHLVSFGAGTYKLICHEKIGLRASAAIVYDTGTLGTDAGFLFRGSDGLDWNISKIFTFNVVGINWYIPLTPRDDRVINAVFYTGITFKF